MTCELKGGGTFLHVPKTGGTWVYDVLKAAGIAETNIGQEHTSDCVGTWAFCVLRNPDAWWLSVYRHQVDSGWRGYIKTHPLHLVGRIKPCSVLRWIEIASTEYAGFCGELFSKYAPACEYILQTERLRGGLAKLAAIKGWGEINFNTPPANASKSWFPIVHTTAFINSEPEAYKLWNNANL